MTRRFKALLALAVTSLAGFGSNVNAADWVPKQPLRMIVPFAAGGMGDLVARTIGDKLGAALGQPVVVDNRGGAGGVIGTEAAAKSPPDGYTLLLGSDSNFTISPNLGPLRYDPVKDFEPVSLIVNTPMVLAVNPQKVPVANVQELLAFARAHPGQLSIASTGNGSSHHLAAELLKSAAKVNLLHVPYKGQAAALTDVLGGQVDMAFSTLGPLGPHLKSGKLKALAVSGTQRIPDLPEVPTLAEAGVAGYDVGIWVGVFYPAHTPKAIVERVNGELAKILQAPDVRSKFTSVGYSIEGGKPELLAARIHRDTLMYRKIIQDAGIKAD
jgi:tripartite-type tricarboxylate transporter receptor subunit TctC